MEAILGLFLYSYLYLKVAKPPCLSCFLFNKIGEQDKRADQVLLGSRGCGGGDPDNVHTCK
jgi:hypothetical protein